MKMILYIDDSESYRFLLQEELSEEGFRVFTASGILNFLMYGGWLLVAAVVLNVGGGSVIEEKKVYYTGGNYE